jgi:hypothetical protein
VQWWPRFSAFNWEPQLVKPLLPGLAALVLLVGTTAPAVGEPARRQPAPRIVFGETEASDFEFRERRVIRRTGASTRRAYFGSGETYSDTLARLQEQMSAIRQREALGQIELTPAQEAAKDDMAPALVRALALSRQSADE